MNSLTMKCETQSLLVIHIQQMMFVHVLIEKKKQSVRNQKDDD
jgi:hypothetical protein